MLTPRINSLIVTCPSPLQSPTHTACARAESTIKPALSASVPTNEVAFFMRDPSRGVNCRGRSIFQRKTSAWTISEVHSKAGEMCKGPGGRRGLCGGNFPLAGESQGTKQRRKNQFHSY